MLRFTEPVTLVRNGVRLLDATGRAVPVGHPDGLGRDVHVPVPDVLPRGAYVLTWRVVSADTHPVAGAVAFTIGSAAPAAAAVAVASTDEASVLTRTVFTLVRWAAFLGLVLLVGTVSFVRMCWPTGAVDPVTRGLARAGVVTLAAATGAGLLVQGVYTTARPLLDALDLALLGETVQTPFGRLAVTRLAVVAVAAATLPALLRRRSAAAAAGTLVLGTALLLTFAASGHAVASAQRPLALAGDVLHMAAMSVWVGGLVVLAVRLLRSPHAEALPQVMPAFSRVAFTSVCVLVVTGTYQSWREVGNLPALTGTTYGRLLLLKLVTVAALLGLGNLGRRWIRRHFPGTVVYAHTDTLDVPSPTPAPAPGDVRQLRRSVAAEVALAMIVLAVTAALVATPPARTSVTPPTASPAAEPAPAAGPATAVLALPDGNRVHLAVAPAAPGPNMIGLHVTTPAGQTLDAEEVTTTASLPDRGIERPPIALHRVAAGLYAAHGAQLPLAGTWRFAVTVRSSDVDASVAETAITIRGHIATHTGSAQ